MPGGHGTFEAATAHHKYNKESTALREIYKQIYKTDRQGFLKNKESINSFPCDLFSELSLA